ncbi:MAG: hypothetical protein JW934_06800 [Anaerolineae bacterium]|nr:hypothetical protein [Anaerolineae bacterium]
MSVRVCFSPSQLTHLDIDNARTALFNWLFARQYGGAFVLRGRVESELDALCTELRWLGLDWDEQPILQSERLALYQAYARQLVDQGQAHHNDAQSTTAESAISLKISHNGQIHINDLVLREFDSALNDPFPIDLDGHPSPLFADVVDDHLSEVTHVIRSVDDLPDVPYRLQLYEALGWTPPQFAHLPSIADHRDTPLHVFRSEGYFPPALVNALALLGWSPKGKRRVWSLDKLVAQFDIRRISRHPATFDRDALDWFNRRYLSQFDAETLAEMFIPRWQDAFGVAHRADGTGLSPVKWQRLVTAAIRDETHYLAQAVDLARPFFADQFPVQADAVETLAQPYAPDVLRAFVDGLSTLEPFAYDPLDRLVTALRYQFKNSHGIRSRDSMFVVRAALTGQLGGPCLIEACLLLGRTRCIERAQAALQ